MSTKKKHPKLRMNRLRFIGWHLWDPIGLLPEGVKWDAEDAEIYVDEYDTYLMQAAGQLRAGKPDSDVVDYLLEIETDYMGLSPNWFKSRWRAKRVVNAIKKDSEIWSQPKPA